jgi:CRISPR-associated protein Csh2
MENNKDIVLEKSEILFLYEGKNNEPNGDPFTGEQRYDEETKKVLISDVRIKRYIRDFIDEYDVAEIKQEGPAKDASIEKGELIYIKLDRSNVTSEGKESGSAARMATLKKQFPEHSNGNTIEVLKKCIDVRLFGGISTEGKDAVNITGPVQFALLNPSLNQVVLKPHQNTTTFPSKMKTQGGEDQRGSIGTKAVVPYSINQIHGWINPKSAEKTGATNADVKKMFYALWNQVNIINTRSKANHSSLLLIQIVYNQPFQKIYGIDSLVDKKLKNEEMKDEQIRSLDDFQFDFTKLIKAAASVKIKEVRFYTEIEDLKTDLTFEVKENEKEGDSIKPEFAWKEKFKIVDFSDIKLTSQKDESHPNNSSGEMGALQTA